MIQISVDSLHTGQVVLENGRKYKVVSTGRNSVNCQDIDDDSNGIIILRGQYKIQNFVIVEQ